MRDDVQVGVGVYRGGSQKPKDFSLKRRSGLHVGVCSKTATTIQPYLLKVSVSTKRRITVPHHQREHLTLRRMHVEKVYTRTAIRWKRLGEVFQALSAQDLLFQRRSAAARRHRKPYSHDHC